MKHIDDNSYASHQEITLLLPWYVNKTLQGAELDTVKQHLNNCLICNRELLNLQNLSGLINQASTVELSAQGSFAKLKKRLHPAEVAQQSVVPFARPGKGQSRINSKYLNISREFCGNHKTEHLESLAILA